MALTVTDDLVDISNAESIIGWIGDDNNIIKNPFLEPNIKVQGLNAIRYKHSLVGLGWVAFDTGAANVDITDQHLFFWGLDLDAVETKANGGWRMSIGTDVDVASNKGAWFVGGVETVKYSINSFFRFCVDPLQPFDAIIGTPPDITAVRSFALEQLSLSATTRETFIHDSVQRGTGITITGATGGSSSAAVAILAEDETRGLFKGILGSYYILGRVTIGDVTAATDSTFNDTNQVWIFEDQNVSATFHKLEFVGGTGTNIATFGTTDFAAGNDKEGSGGNTFVAAGPAPFRIEAIDSGITVEFFGCNFTNSPALRDDALRNFVVEDNNLGSPTFTDDTRDANDAGANDAPSLPNPINTNDAAYFGHNERFSIINANVGTTTGIGIDPTYEWEYSLTSGWSTLEDITDGTTNLTAVGLNTLTYAIPDDWDKQTVNGNSRYWIRMRALTQGFGTTTPSILTQVTVSMGGGVRWEQANAEAIRCTFTNMDTIRIRHGAKFKKCIVTDSVAVAKNGAIDLGSSDPAADTFRDVTVQNCNTGILFKGTSTGTTTYNLRNIQLANNTNDFRVDFPAAAKVIIRILEGGDIPNTLDNVNGSTLSIKSTISVTVHVEDSNQVNIEGAQVYLQKSTPTAFTSGSGNSASNGTLVVTQTIDSDMPDAGTCIVYDKSLNATFPYRYASHDGANTFTLPTLVTRTASGSQPDSATELISSTNLGITDIQEGDTIQNTTDGSFAVIDKLASDDLGVTTSPLQGGTDNLWQAGDGFSLHTLATALESGVDTIDVPLLMGQTDASGDITLSYNYATDVPVVIRVRKNSPEFATKYEPSKSNSTITFQGITIDVALQEDTVAT